MLRHLILDAGTPVANWDLDEYRTKDDLANAILALPMITTAGNEISDAMRTLRREVLSYGWRGYNNYIQKVALILIDDRAPDPRELEAAYQVLNVTYEGRSKRFAT